MSTRMSQKKKNIDEAKAAMARATNSQTSGTTTGGLQTGQVIQVNQPEHVCPYCGRCKHCGQPVPPPIYPHPVIIPAPTVPPYQPFPFPFPYIGDPLCRHIRLRVEAREMRRQGVRLLLVLFCRVVLVESLM